MNNHLLTHEESAELLPWYVNGTLNPTETTLVRNHVKDCPECRDDIELLRDVESAVNKTSIAAITPRPPVDAFLSSLDSQSESVAGPFNYRIWAVAASIVVAAGLFVTYVGDSQPITGDGVTYETVTSADPNSSMEYVVQIHFAEETTARDRAGVLDSMQGRDLVADDQDGVFRLVVKVPGTSLAEAEEYAARIAARQGVNSARIVAVQLPAREHQ